MQSLCWGSAALGGLLAAYFSGSLLEIMGPTDVFKITAVLPLLVASIAFFINENPIKRKNETSTLQQLQQSQVTQLEKEEERGGLGFVVEMQPERSTIISSLPISTTANAEVELIHPEEEQSGVSNQIQSLCKAIKEPAVWKPALFLFLWQSTPTSEGAFLYFMTNDLGFGPEFLGRVRLVTAAASLLGVWGYQKFLREVRRGQKLSVMSSFIIPLNFADNDSLLYNKNPGTHQEYIALDDNHISTIRST